MQKTGHQPMDINPSAALTAQTGSPAKSGGSLLKAQLGGDNPLTIKEAAGSNSDILTGVGTRSEGLRIRHTHSPRKASKSVLRFGAEVAKVLPLNQVVCCDALTFLRRLPTGSVDLVVTSPPYNLRNSTGHGMRGGGNWQRLVGFGEWYDCHHDNMPHDQYVAWQRAILAECMRVIKPTGAIFYNHKWRVQNGLLQDRADITAGFPVRQIVIWDRGSGFNFNPGYFVPTFEVIYLIAKPEFKLHKDMISFGDVWHISPDTESAHPAPMPFEVAHRCIKSTNAQVILDPFCGHGTTLAAAYRCGRNYIGCDISPEYVKSAQSRLSQPYTPALFDSSQADETLSPTQLAIFEAI